MKQPRRWMYVLGLLAITGAAAGCGTESPTGPSFARTPAPVETAAGKMPLGEDPGSFEGGSWTGESDPDAVDRSTGRKPKKPKNPNHANGQEKGDDDAPFERGN
jgi:hypothetical protein